MSDFALGPIKVIDNGDGVYSEPVKGAKTTQDQIVDGAGKTVASTGAEAKAALKALGIGSLQGLKLSPASRYLDAMGQAQGYAAAGDTPQLQQVLRKARTAAAEAKLTFSETRATALLEKSLTKELDLVVGRATTASANGEVIPMQDALSAGREILGRLKLTLDQAKTQGLPLTADVIAQLETQGYSNAIPLKWKEAEAAAKAGDLTPFRAARDKIREYSSRAGQTLSAAEEKKLGDLELETYQNSVDVHLAEAEAGAKLGDVDRVRFHLKEAEEGAVLGKKPLSTKQKFRRRSAEMDALKNAPDFYLPLAEAKADLGLVEPARAFIQLAKDCRGQVGRSLTKAETQRAEAIEKKALLLSIDVLLKKAAKQIDQVKKDGGIADVKDFIHQARTHAGLIGSSLSQAQETSAAQILTQAYDAAVEWRFKQAEGSALLGKVDDTVVPLNAGRELAKQGKVSFDESRAKSALDTALTNGIELEFKIAEKIAASGDREATLRHLDTARENARRVGQKFDEARA
ncbi:MAG TPA: hypothetical protein VJP40_01755, partial [bacterium]|nr:hypothetical protein [bacterium]